MSPTTGRATKMKTQRSLPDQPRIRVHALQMAQETTTNQMMAKKNRISPLS